MQAALERVRTGEVTQAVRDASVDVRRDPRGRLDRARRATASSRPRSSPADAVCALLDELVDDDSEIVTVLVGADAARQATPSASASTSRSRSRTLEVEFHDGGQPLYPYLVGVE